MACLVPLELELNLDCVDVAVMAGTWKMWRGTVTILLMRLDELWVCIRGLASTSSFPCWSTGTGASHLT